MNYLIFSADNQAFTIVSTAYGQELQSAIADFIGEQSKGKKDYFSNYNVHFVDLLSRDDDTLFRVYNYFL